jgi:Acetoacetate decarboxylase (ADC)
MTDTTIWGEVQGREITFPMEVTELRAATLLWSVPAEAASALLPGDAFEVVEVAPGTAQLVLAAVDYVQNPWGDYDELNLGFLARPAGAPADVIGSFVYRMPVNQAFTCEAGNRVMGFPKTVEDLSVTYTDTTASFRLAMGGQHVLTLTLPRAEATGPAERVEATSYSYLDGVPYGTDLSMDMGTGFIDAADVQLELGDSPVADELRSLGLPCPPDLATWGEGLSATFLLGRPI